MKTNSLYQNDTNSANYNIDNRNEDSNGRCDEIATRKIIDVLFTDAV
jgi:hypothetical protein